MLLTGDYIEVGHSDRRCGSNRVDAGLRNRRDRRAFSIVDAAKRPFSGSSEYGMEQCLLEVLDRFGIVKTIVNAGHADLPLRQYTGDGESGANRCGICHCAI